jgi:4'-phosphopantetheinyl transferase EntD
MIEPLLPAVASAEEKIGAPAVPILPDVDGAPRWPAGLAGSMTHCAGYRAAVVSRCHDGCGVGIGAEPHAPASVSRARAAGTPALAGAT